MRLLDKAFPHSPQTLHNSHWLFKKIQLRDGLGEFCLLYFLILQPPDFTSDEISDVTCTDKARSIPNDDAEYSDLEVYWDNF